MSVSKAGSGGIKTFFLYNIEKLILGVSLILLGLFFYLGLNSEKFDKSPDNLVQESSQATSYIEQDSNWKNIEAYRHGDVEVVDRVEQASKPVDPSEYKIAGLSMVPKALQLRMDPPLPEIKDVESHVLRAAVIVQSNQKSRVDSILQLPLARPKGDMKKTSARRSNFDDEDDMDEDSFSSSQRRGSNRGRTEKDPQEDADVDAGTGLPGVQVAEQGGVRPKSMNTSNDMALTRNIVVVNALIDHKSLWKVFEKTLSSSLGYYPKRDLPRYDFLQVERREIKNGQPTEWKDISTFVNFDQANLFPSNFTSAPEVVSPENYDQFLTNAIPPILGVDYTNEVLHSKLSKRVFKVPEDFDTGLATAAMLSGDKDPNVDDGMLSRNGEGIRRQKRGLSGRSTGSDRIRNNFRGEGRSSRSSSRKPGDGRSSTDLTEYEEMADVTVEPVANYKQVRFFDMSVVPNSSAVYEYRMRVWLADPNNADEKAVAAMKDDDNSRRSGLGGIDGMTGVNGINGEEKKIFKKTKINFTMQDQTVRNRLKRAREEGDITAREYFVSEEYGDSDKPVEIKVPTGEEYLRHDRPTQWSDPVRVVVKGPEPEFYAERIEEPRTARVGSVEIPVDEVKAEIVTSVESTQYQGTQIAAKRLFAVGDLLNFDEPVTLMHPVTQSVHFLADFDFRSNGVLIDIMGGQRLDVSRNEPMQYELPGETLIMNADGEFEISNDIEDLELAREALRLPDEKAEFGGKKAARRAEEEKMEMMKGGRRGR